MFELNKIYCGDVLQIVRQMLDECVDCIINGSPYFGVGFQSSARSKRENESGGLQGARGENPG